MNPFDEYQMSLDPIIKIREKLNLEHNVSPVFSIKHQTWLLFRIVHRRHTHTHTDYFTTLPVPDGAASMAGRLVNNEWQECRRKVSLPNLTKYCIAFLEDLREPRKIPVIIAGLPIEFRISHFSCKTTGTLLAKANSLLRKWEDHTVTCL
jgi:hypothetical protein